MTAGAPEGAAATAVERAPPPAPRPASQRLPAAIALLGAAGAIAPWLLAATGHGLARGLSQVTAGVGVALLVWSALRWAGRALAAEFRASRAVGWGLVVLLALAIAVHFAGLGFEVGRGYYRDEGIYRAAAERINNGAPLPHNFIYGHLSYYLVAWVLWLHGLFPAPTTAIAAGLTGLESAYEVSWLWIRFLSAACGSLTTLLVFGIARRIVRGPAAAMSARVQAAGFLGAALITAATIYNEVTHVYISDVPAAFFATLCLYFVARLTGRETLRDYLLAGVAAGLAAGCKYPAGVVAVAIAGVWAWWRWRERRWSWSLLLAAAASVATFLTVMPAFVVHARDAFAGSGRDVFFGVRQYAESGWIGVEKNSNAAWYGGKLLETFGIGALLLGAAGICCLERAERRRTLVMAVFPLAYGALVCSMSMVVKRNLQPLLPIAAALLGVGAAALAAWAAARWPRRRLVAALAVALGVLGVPTVAVVQQDLSMTLPGTRELVVEWMRAHVPPGAGVIKESYTPHLEPELYDVLQTRFAARVEPAELWSGRYDFVLLADSAYGRFLEPDNLRKGHQRTYAERYRTLLALPEAQAFSPSKTRLGPGFSLRRLDPPTIAYRTEREFSAADAAFLSDAAMAATPGVLEFSTSGQYALFKEYLEAGVYDVEIEARLVGNGALRAQTVENEPLGDIVITAAGHADAGLNVPARAKGFFYLELPPGSQMRSLRVRSPRGPEVP